MLVRRTVVRQIVVSVYLALAFATLLPSLGFAVNPSFVWGPGAAAVSVGPKHQLRAKAVPDGSDGVIWVWEDDRLHSGVADLYGQRLTADGEALWETNGRSLATAQNIYGEPVHVGDVAMLADGSGGAFIVWADSRTFQADIYAQRIDGNGNRVWGSADVPIATYGWPFNSHGNPQVVTDGAGGIIIVWEEQRQDHPSIWAQRVNGTGQILWPTDGVPVVFTDDPAYSPHIVTDGAGGIYVAWQDFREADGIPLYLQHLAPDGTPFWTVNGLRVTPPLGQMGPAGFQMITDGSQGAILVWVDCRSGCAPDVGPDLYAQRINGAGQKLWGSSDVRLVDRKGAEYSPALASDGAGGAIIAWPDYNASPPGSGQTWIMAQRITATGATAWQANGVTIYDIHASEPQIAPDGAGGAIIVWDGFEYTAGPKLRAQRIDPLGQALWSPGGVQVWGEPMGHYGFGPRILDLATGDAVVYWTDYRLPRDTDWDLFAQRLADLPPAAALADLQVTVSVNPATIRVGEDLEATITVTNKGPTVATDVTVVHMLPTTLIPLDASSGCGLAGESVVCSLGTQASGEMSTITLLLRAIYPGDYCYAFTASSQQLDPDWSGNLATICPTILCEYAPDDSDGDCVADSSDNCPVTFNMDQVDYDGDGLGNACDNCTLSQNPDQRDTDGDSYGNVCDADFDNSLFVNFADLAFFKSKFGTNNPDADIDGNGFVNFSDLAAFKTLFGKAPGPSCTNDIPP